MKHLRHAAIAALVILPALTGFAVNVKRAVPTPAPVVSGGPVPEVCPPFCGEPDPQGPPASNPDQD